jgi:hypothetical protein
MPERKMITLYLAGWQRRMVRDHLKTTQVPEKFSRMRISPKIPKKEWVMYRQPIFEQMKAGSWDLYLTDEQIDFVVDEFGVEARISALNISPGMLEEGVVAFV